MGTFTEFTIRTFHYIYAKCKENEQELVADNVTYKNELFEFLYSEIYDEQEHMGKVELWMTV